MTRSAIAWSLAAMLSVMLSVPTAKAHPHVWTAVKTELIMKDSLVRAVRHHWTFDEAFSAFASQGLDEDGDGKLSRAELQPLAQVNVESLEEYEFFSDLYEEGTAATKERIFGDPVDYFLTIDDTQLTLHFTLPVLVEVDAKKKVLLEVYDPSFFVDFAFSSKQPATLVDAPKGCKMDLKMAQDLDSDTMDALAQIPADQRELPEELMKLTVTMANQVILTCK
ncbi:MULTISPECIES: DUF1007 family protein [Cohaesibacter]|uniref:DUF1007 family protein n=1 Tax=Cohaesibacter TaxID=655352 RepID=UPI000DEA0F5E|nr:MULTISPECIES: DUF1007 family protein [Cohaesibacter]TLP42787.1 DUF1007 family protein [Cohaesibacter sp. CAU 1516]